jgi:DNA-binding NarL/FixJ family response regulator
LAKGFLYKEIAEAMNISYDTVHTHIRKIYEKLHVRSRTEAVAKHLGRGAPHVPATAASR